MRKRGWAGVPVQVYNLGSPAGAQMDFGRDELWRRMDAETGKKAVSLPVFLVNPDQMDTLYPPGYRRALDPERIRGMLNEEVLREAQEMRREQREEEPDFFERLRRREEEWRGWQRYSRVVAVGLYLHLERRDQTFRNSVLEEGDLSVRTSESENAFRNHEAPAVFLCCERIVDWASRVGVSQHLVMDKVYYHELGHAIMDTVPSGVPDPYLEIWGLIVEESLANAIAYRCFDGTEARWVQRLILDQPAEYLGYTAAGQILVGQASTEYWRQLRYIWPHWEYRKMVERVFDRLERVMRHPATAHAAIRVLSYLPPFALTPLQTEHIDSENIAAWKLFKRENGQANPAELQVWKDFAKYLLIEGVS